MSDQGNPVPAKTILVVDDDQVILATLSLKLKAAGYEVVTAVDASSAIASVQRQQPHLILLDISFPPDVAHGGTVDWDGFRIMDWLHHFGLARRVPVFIISGTDAAKCAGRVKASGAAGFFQKPIDHDKLLDSIKQALASAVDTEPAPKRLAMLVEAANS